MGTGTGDMIDRCRKAGLPEPQFTLADGFTVTLRRQPDRAFAAVGGPSPVAHTTEPRDKSQGKSRDKSQGKSRDKSPRRSGG